MTKGQSIIIQFLTFFVIGFFVFISIGMFFKYQSDLFRDSILASNVNLTSSYLSAATVVLVDGCKECDFSTLTVRLKNTSAGYPIEFAIKDSKLVTSIPGTDYLLATSIHNLLLDTIAASGSSSSVEPIILMFNRTNYSLKVD